MMQEIARDAESIFRAAVEAVQAPRSLAEAGIAEVVEGCAGRVFVIGAGKAAMAMAGVISDLIGHRITEGLVVVPHGYPAHYPDEMPLPSPVEVMTGGHPTPDHHSVQAAERCLALAEKAGTDDLVLVLLSGGGSALWTSPASGLTLSDVQQVTDKLLTSGATIHEINTVRKHLSRIKGGQLAAASAPATLRAYAISDVIGNDLSVIASGPTVPDESTFAEAREVLQTYACFDSVEGRIGERIEQGIAGAIPETPSKGSSVFDRSKTVCVASNDDAVRGAAQRAQALGYTVQVLSETVEGEARQAGTKLGKRLARIAADQPVCILSGGETTVTVTGEGIGGRNQELVLGAVNEIGECAGYVFLLSAGTDGIDGPTDDAGGWVDSRTAAACRARGLSVQGALRENDSNALLRSLGQLVTTGPTHTNVMDVQVGVRLPD